MKYYLLTFNEDWANEHNVPALECFKEEDFIKWKKLKIYPSAYLGNNGDNFMDDEQGKTGAELLKSYVSSRLVDESFYKTFHKAGLSDLSLSNVFDLEQEGNDDEDEDGYRKEDYYETKGVGTGARSVKMCGRCGGTILMGIPHDVHTFHNGDYFTVATHKQCTKAFMNNLK